MRATEKRRPAPESLGRGQSSKSTEEVGIEVAQREPACRQGWGGFVVGRRSIPAIIPNDTDVRTGALKGQLWQMGTFSYTDDDA